MSEKVAASPGEAGPIPGRRSTGSHTCTACSGYWRPPSCGWLVAGASGTAVSYEERGRHRPCRLRRVFPRRAPGSTSGSPRLPSRTAASSTSTASSRARPPKCSWTRSRASKIDQSILGRLLDYGKVTVLGTGAGAGHSERSTRQSRRRSNCAITSPASDAGLEARRARPDLRPECRDRLDLLLSTGFRGARPPPACRQARLRSIRGQPLLEHRQRTRPRLARRLSVCWAMKRACVMRSVSSRSNPKTVRSLCSISAIRSRGRIAIVARDQQHQDTAAASRGSSTARSGAVRDASPSRPRAWRRPRAVSRRSPDNARGRPSGRTSRAPRKRAC